MSRKIEVDTKTFIRFWLVILGFVLAGLFVWKAMTGLIIVGIAIFLAIAIKPLARSLDKIDKTKDRPVLASVSAYVIVMLALFFVFSVIGPAVVNETVKFVGQVPEMFENTLGGWDGVNNFGNTIGIENLQTRIYDGMKDFSETIMNDFGNTVINSVGILGSVATSVILVMVLTLLFLLDGPNLSEGFWRLMKSHDAKKNESTKLARHIVDRMKNVVATYASNQVLVALIDGTVVAIAVVVLSIIFGFSAGLALPLGLISMFFYLIPMFGPIIGCVIVSLLLLFSSPFAGIAFAIFYIVYSQIENNVIAPKLQGNALKMPALVILVAITIGIYMFGLIGALIAIPVAGCIKVLIDEYPKIKELKEN